jgi:hypothetical protein
MSPRTSGWFRSTGIVELVRRMSSSSAKRSTRGVRFLSMNGATRASQPALRARPDAAPSTSPNGGERLVARAEHVEAKTCRAARSCGVGHSWGILEVDRQREGRGLVGRVGSRARELRADAGMERVWLVERHAVGGGEPGVAILDLQVEDQELLAAFRGTPPRGGSRARERPGRSCCAGDRSARGRSRCAAARPRDPARPGSCRARSLRSV